MKTSWANLQFALYCASIIIGAGLLTMPLTGRLLGFVPLLVITVLIGFGLVAVYQRLARTLFVHVSDEANRMTEEAQLALRKGAGITTNSRRWRLFYRAGMIRVVVEQGAALLHDVVDRTGIGTAGHATLLLGTFFYVFFADIAYLIIGQRSLNAVARLFKGQGAAVHWSFLALGVVLVITSLALPLAVHRRSASLGAFQKLFMMAGWWCLTIFILIITGGTGPVLGNASMGSILATVLFLIAVIAPMSIGSQEGDEPESREGPKAHHRVNVIVMIVELFLLIISGVLIVWIFLGNGAMVPFYAFAPDWLSTVRLNDWSRVLGVVLFAFVGTGIFNLVSYPQLFDRNHGGNGKPRFGHVVALGTLIPMIVYLGWTMVVAISLSPQDLAMADSINEPTTIAIVRKALALGQQEAWIIALTGYLFALMAVTSACNGFTESLADQIAIATQNSGRKREALIDFRPIILVGAGAVALARDIFAASIDISAILSLAGTAGGGLLILIFPLFLPYPPDRRARARYWEVAVVLIITVVLVVGIVNEPTDGPGLTGSVITWTKWFVALGVAGVTLWLLVSEPSGRVPYQADWEDSKTFDRKRTSVELS